MRGCVSGRLRISRNCGFVCRLGLWNGHAPLFLFLDYLGLSWFVFGFIFVFILVFFLQIWLPIRFAKNEITLFKLMVLNMENDWWFTVIQISVRSVGHSAGS